MRYALILAIPAPLAATEQDDAQAVLERATAKVLDSNRRVPNYTCVETVSRQYFRPVAVQLPHACQAILEIRRHPTPDFSLQHFMTDRLRLDVAMIRHGEIFSWAGASRFNDHFMDRTVGYGPLGTGLFGALLMVIFQSDVKQVAFLGSKTIGGGENSWSIPLRFRNRRAISK